MKDRGPELFLEIVDQSSRSNVHFRRTEVERLTGSQTRMPLDSVTNLSLPAAYPSQLLLELMYRLLDQLCFQLLQDKE